MATSALLLLPTHSGSETGFLPKIPPGVRMQDGEAVDHRPQPGRACERVKDRQNRVETHRARHAPTRGTAADRRSEKPVDRDLQAACILPPRDEEKRAVRVVLPEPAGAGVGVVEHEQAPPSLREIVTRAIQQASGDRTLPRGSGSATSGRVQALCTSM